MELNVLEGAHGTKPMRLCGGQVGLENMKNTHNLFQDLWNESLVKKGLYSKSFKTVPKQRKKPANGAF